MHRTMLKSKIHLNVYSEVATLLRATTRLAAGAPAAQGDH